MSAVIGVTGTDTGVGKTVVACALLRALRAAGHVAAGYKPVASGAEVTLEGLRNEDALALLDASTPGPAYADINPVTYAPAIAPHVAAAREGRPVDPAVLDAGLAALRARSDRVVVEGAGGWRVPLTPDLDFADWFAAHRMPVVLVVGLKLGAINHALLSARAMRGDGCWAGWVANHLPDEATGTADEMVATLSARLGPPLVRIGSHEPITAMVEAWTAALPRLDDAMAVGAAAPAV